MQRILIADSSSQKPNGYINSKEVQNKNFEVILCQNGLDFHRMVMAFDPDLIFLDAHMCNTDALKLLADLRLTGNMVPVVVLVETLQDVILKQLFLLDVVAILQKPFTMDDVKQQIEMVMNVTRWQAKWSVNLELDYILFRLGFKAGCKKLARVRAGVLEEYHAVTDISLTKELYPAVAKTTGGNATNVEKAIRDGIRIARVTGDPDLWQAFFPSLKKGEYPTNEEFLSRLAIALKQRERPRKTIKQAEKAVATR